jgi:hypothetical protein
LKKGAFYLISSLSFILHLPSLFFKNYMLSKVYLISIIAFCTFLFSCENTPSEYFDRTALNSNLLVGFGASDFKMMQDYKNANQLLVFDDKSSFPAKSFEDYVLNNKVKSNAQVIQKIKDLKPTDETTLMINAALELFTFAEDKYKTDYVSIARLMDSKASQQEIDAAIAKMESENFPIFIAKHKKLWDLAMPYAENHGIKVVRN